jgi:predicted nucleic acid-binding protein
VIVLDASALIAFLGPSDALHERAVWAVLDLGPHELGVSPITHAEVLVGPIRAGTLERTRAALAALAVSELALSTDAAPRLAGLRADTGLKLPDCCVLLAALQSRSAILTFDQRLAAVARQLGIEVAKHAP